MALGWLPHAYGRWAWLLALAGCSATRGARAPEAATASDVRLRPLFSPGTSPTLLAAGATLQLGMPLAAARASAPELFAAGGYAPPGLDDVDLSAQGDAYGRLGSLVLTLGCASALADAMALWGTPTWGYDRGAKAKLYWWFNPTIHLRATLETPDAAGSCRLVLDRYLPVSELLGGADDRFGFEKEPLLGMAEADVTRAYADALPSPTSRPCSQEILVLPPVEYDRTFTRVHLGCAHGRVVGFELGIRYGLHLALKGTVLDLLRQRFGAPTTVTLDFLRYPAGPLLVRFQNQPVVSDLFIEVHKAVPANPP